MGIVTVDAGGKSYSASTLERSDSDPAGHNMRYLRNPKTADQPLVSG
jgi:hypothetical protein